MRRHYWRPLPVALLIALTLVPGASAVSTSWSFDLDHDTVPFFADGGFVEELDQTPENAPSFSFSSGTTRYFPTEGSPPVPSNLAPGSWTVGVQFSAGAASTHVEAALGRFVLDDGSWAFVALAAPVDLDPSQSCAVAAVDVSPGTTVEPGEYLTLRLVNDGGGSANFVGGAGTCSHLTSPETGDYVPVPEVPSAALSLVGLAALGACAVVLQRRRA